MADIPPGPSRPAEASDSSTPLPEVRLEVQHANAPPTVYAVSDVGFLIGTVPGCDLRLPGADLAPVLCLIARRPGGVSLRKLALTQPVTVNGRPTAHASLASGDRVAVGPVELVVLAQQPPAAAEAPGEQQRRQELEALATQLEEKSAELEADRVCWYERREQIEREYRERAQAVELLRQEQDRDASVPLDLRERERAVAARAEELRNLQSSLETRAAEVEKQRQEMAGLRQELADIRRQLYERYQERRDRLAGLQEAVDRAARKVQERKRQVEVDLREVEAHRQAEAARRAELERARHQLEVDRLALEQTQRVREEKFAARIAECQAQEQRLALEARALEEGQKQHQADLVRLDRLRGALDQREADLKARDAELDARQERLGEWHNQLQASREQVEKRKAEQEAEAAALQQRATALDAQQTMLANLRTRLERMREEAQQGEQLVIDERIRLEVAERDLQQRQGEAQALRAELDSARVALNEGRRLVAERTTLLESATAQLRLAEERMGEEEQRQRRQAEEMQAKSAEQAETAAALEARAAQCAEAEQRLEADRQSLRERSVLLAQAEQAREALQEQLRRRSEELSARQKTLADQARQQETDAATLETRRAEFEAQQQGREAQAAALLQEIEQRTRDLAQREGAVREDLVRANELTRGAESERLALEQQRAELEALKQQTLEVAERARSEHEAARREAVELRDLLPELELRAGSAFERVSSGRDQLREHLAEVHAYASQCQDDLDAVRSQLQAEGERLLQREQNLRRSQDEHRLAVVAFRQQLIDWQAQVGEMKRLLAQDETRLERRQAAVSEQARQVDEESARLAEQAARLQQQELLVEGQRQEMTGHLHDMREWYRRKLRELAGISDPDAADPEAAPAEPVVGTGRDILSLTGNVDPADRQLGDLLGSLGLIEADTLTALLMEARRQRRSLREVLLASGTVTLYQLSLIEAGNIDALMLGPVRVVDRLRETAHEAVYRVFDPRRNGEALLRHLAEAEMQDAVRPDEFRQRFAQSMLAHPNLAATLEVLEIADRPAVLQEWLSGLPSSDWPTLAGVPGVWFRLLNQAALGLSTAHEAGLVHGRLSAERVLLTGDGFVKLCGLGEPPWLAAAAAAAPAEEAAADLRALGKIAAGWCESGGKKKGPKAKPLPESLRLILERLRSDDPAAGYPTAAALLDDLDQAGAEVPANAEAWDRLLRHVREHATPEAALRQSA